MYPAWTDHRLLCRQSVFANFLQVSIFLGDLPLLFEYTFFNFVSKDACLLHVLHKNLYHFTNRHLIGMAPSVLTKVADGLFFLFVYMLTFVSHRVNFYAIPLLQPYCFDFVKTVTLPLRNDRDVQIISLLSYHVSGLLRYYGGDPILT